MNPECFSRLQRLPCVHKGNFFSAIKTSDLCSLSFPDFPFSLFLPPTLSFYPLLPLFLTPIFFFSFLLPSSLFPSFPPSLPSFLLSCPSVSILPCSPSQICLELVITCLNLPSVEITGASYYYIWLASSRVCVCGMVDDLIFLFRTP